MKFGQYSPAIYLFFLILTSFRLYAGDYTFTLYNVADGLPSPYVYDICQDSRGFLWLGTTAGISRFDGKNFKNYNTNDGLISNRITHVYENRKHQIVVGTYRGLSIYDGSKFTNFPTPGPMRKSWFTDFFEWDNGRLKTVLNDTLYQLNKGGLQKFSLHPGLDTLQYTEIAELRDGRRALVAEGKLFVLHPDKRLQVVHFPKKIYCFVVGPRPSDDLVVVAEDGVFRFQRDRFYLIYQYNFADKIILHRLRDSRRRIWVSIENKGVLLFEDNKLVLLDGKDGLDPTFTTCIFEDNRRRIWMGSGRGLYQVKKSQTRLYDLNNGLAEKDIRHMQLASDGNVYLAQNSKWYAYVKDGAVYQPPVRLQQKLAPLMKGYRVNGFAVDDQNRLWIARMGGKLFRIKGVEIEDLSEKFGTVDFYDQEIFFNQSDSTMWLPLQKGIVLVKRDEVVKFIKNKPDGSPLGNVAKVRSDGKGNVWLSTKDEMFLFSNNRLSSIQLPLAGPNTYNYFQCEQNGLLWFVAESKGVVGCALVDGKLILKENITEKNGLPSFQAISVAADEQHGLWIATMAGICRVSSKKRSATGRYHVYKFSNTDGVPFTNYGVTQVIKDNRGDIWSCNLDGLLHFNTRSQYMDVSPPTIVLENVAIKNALDEWEIKAEGASFFALPRNPQLRYDENNIGFTFSGISLSGGNLSYQYKLDGLENQWHEQDEKTSIYYNNLKSGDYTFMIKAVAPQGIESEVVSYAFTITPAFWETWWFRYLMVVAIIGIIYFFIKRREAAINHDNKVQLQMSELRMQALHSQMNPHFLFNSLNSVQNYLLSNRGIEGAKYLSKFSKLVRRIMENSNHQYLSFEEIIETLRMYVEIESFRFNHEFKYAFDIEENELLLDAMLPPMLLQPYVENAIWHGLMPKKGEKSLKIFAWIEANYIICLIEDNGVGRGFSPRTKGHISRGQEMTKGIFESLRIKDSSAKIEVIDLFDHDQKPAGTQVRMQIPL